MLDSAREFVSSHNDVSKLVRNAQRFSVQLPVIGKVSVPPPDQLAFYGVLAVLGVTELIPWPIAVGLGVGHALATRHATGVATETATEAAEDAVAEALVAEAEGHGAAVSFTPAKKAPAKKAAKPAPSRTPVAKKTPARTAPTKKA